MSFEKILRHAQQGDAAALEQLLELYQPLLIEKQLMGYCFGRNV